MAKKKSRTNKVRSKKVSNTLTKPTGTRGRKPQRKSIEKPIAKGPTAPITLQPARPTPSQTFDDSRVFTIEIDSIRAETTIGDLIVAFPRTRDVLMKHGLRFEVEEAGYLYMTLNVFSAIQVLALTGLLQVLDVATNEMTLLHLAPPIRQIVLPPTTRP